MTGLTSVFVGGLTAFRPTAILIRQSLYMSQVAHQVGTYPGLSSMKRLGAFLLPHEWDAIAGLLPALNSLVPIYTSGWREVTLRVKCLA